MDFGGKNCRLRLWWKYYLNGHPVIYLFFWFPVVTSYLLLESSKKTRLPSFEMPSRPPGDHFGEFLQSYNVNDPSYRVNARQHLALIENAMLQNHEPRLVSLEDFKKEYDSELIPWKISTATRLSQLEEYQSDWDFLKQEQTLMPGSSKPKLIS
jgi:hypothetical protein